MIDIDKLSKYMLQHFIKSGWDMSDYNEVKCSICDHVSGSKFCPNCGTILPKAQEALCTIKQGLQKGIAIQSNNVNDDYDILY